MCSDYLKRVTPLFVIAIVALGLGLLVPTLWSGLMVDDYFQWVLATENPLLHGIEPAKPASLFSFLDGNPERTLQMINRGFLPWWTDPNIKLSFWRPVAEASHWLDYLLWPDNAFLMHLHSLAYLLILLVSILYLFRNTFAERGAWLLASMIFAVSYTHSVPAGWLVNRNALLVVIFLALTLVCHHRWRHSRLASDALLALLCFTLGLLSGEMGVCSGLYLAAYACVFESGWKNKTVSLVPYVIAGTLWLVTRSVLGYGAEYSDHYLDPIASPQLYLLALPGRLYQFAVGLFAVIPPAYQSELPAVTQWVLPLFLLLILGLALPLLKQSLWARFWLLGGVLSLLPVACSLPGNGRLLIASSVGVSAFIAMLILFIWRRVWKKPSWQQFVYIPLLLLLCLLHLPLAAYLNLKTTLVSQDIMNAYLNQPAVNWETREAAEAVILVNAPVSAFASFVDGVRAYYGKPNTPKLWSLASGYNHLRVTTVDEYTIEVSSQAGLYGEFEAVFRSRQNPFQPGDRVELNGLIVTIMAVNAVGIPSLARFQFDEKLAPDNYQVLHWYRSQFRPCRLPEQNASMELSLGSSYCT